MPLTWVAVLADGSAAGQPLPDQVHAWAFLLMLLLTTGFALMTIVLAEKIGPKRPHKVKLQPYECGIEPEAPVLQRMHIQFYRTSIMFLIFGVELIFLYPWAVWARQLGVPGLLMLAPFMVILVVGFLFEWTKGALEWRQKS